MEDNINIKEAKERLAETKRLLQEKKQKEIKKIMAMNRHGRRALAKVSGIKKIPTSNVPYINKNKNK